MDPAKVPGKVTIRDFGAAAAVGESKYGYDLYLAQRGDANIRTFDDLINKAKFYLDDGVPTKKLTLENANKPLVLDTAVRLQRRFAVQQIVLACLAEEKLDAIVCPTGLDPSRKLDAPGEPTTNGLTNYGMFTFLGAQGFPAITVPAGFTTQVYDRVADPSLPPPLRWRAKRKAEVVLRLLRGEALDALSRRSAVPVPRLEEWRAQALVGMGGALQRREADDPAQAKLDEANRRIGELSMEVELLRARCEKPGPFAGRRSRK